MNSAADILRELSRLVSPTPTEKWKVAAHDLSAAYYTSFVNPYSVHVARKAPGYMPNLQLMDEVLTDGILLSIAASWLKRVKVGRWSFDGNSLATAVFEYCTDHNLAIALIGGKPGVAQRAAEVVREAYPGISIPLTRDGYFVDTADTNSTISALQRLRINVVVVGMGAPHQEQFLGTLRAAGHRGAAFSCGGYIDQLCKGNVAYYPKFVEKYDLRAIYRLASEPRRLSRRYFVDYMDFYSAMLHTFLRGRNRRC